MIAHIFMCVYACVCICVCLCVHVFYLCARVCLLVCTYVCIYDHWRECSVAGIGVGVWPEKASSQPALVERFSGRRTFLRGARWLLWDGRQPWVAQTWGAGLGPPHSKASQASEVAGCWLPWKQTFSRRFRGVTPDGVGDF